MLNLFYEEPDPDRWLPFDRHPRRIVRRILRGGPRPGGQTRVFLNLCAGLERLGIAYRVNDYRYIKNNPHDLACIIGKPFLLDKIAWKNPILFGAAVCSHPSDDPHLLRRLQVRKILVPGPWMRDMCRPFWGSAVEAWPVGIDTKLWAPAPAGAKEVDILLYNKVMWEHDAYEKSLLQPIRTVLQEHRRSFLEIRYGCYREEEFRAALARCQTMIFICEHETQGIAYQQALSCGVPILAWDRRGYWQDPSYYPHRVRYAPVSSVPYWDERCGLKFGSALEFLGQFEVFWTAVEKGAFDPRSYILDNLTLESCAQRYVEIANGIVA